MKKILLLLLLVAALIPDAAADEPQRRHRYDMFRQLTIDTNAIVFVGNSITEMFNWNEVIRPHPPYRIYNRGVSGATSDDVLRHIDMLVQGHPYQLVLMIGANDLEFGQTPQHIADNVADIVTHVKRLSPRTQILLHGILPTNVGHRTLADERAANRLLQHLADTAGIQYFDLWEQFQNIPTDTTISLDGLHLTTKGYWIWCDEIAPYLGKMVDYKLPVDTNQLYTAGLKGSMGMRASYFSSYFVGAEIPEVIFFGDEMVKCGEWHELMENPNIRNRAIGWRYEDTTPCIRRTAAAVEATIYGAKRLAGHYMPRATILYTGTGEVNSTIPMDSVENQYARLVETIVAANPSFPLYLVSLMPTAKPNGRIIQFNQWLRQLAVSYENVHYVDIYSCLVQDSICNPAYFSGNYLMGEGYKVVAERLSTALNERYDSDYWTLFNIQQRRSPSCNRFWLTVSNSLILSPVPALGHFVYGVRTKDDVAKLGAAELGASWLLTLGVTSAVKMAVRRPRPYKSYPSELDCLQPVRDPSFPSGHTSLCFATATTLSLLYPKAYVIIPAYLWAAGVGYSRMYIGAHYPTDVVVGAVVGTGCAILAHLVRNSIARKQPSIVPVGQVAMLPLTFTF